MKFNKIHKCIFLLLSLTALPAFSKLVDVAQPYAKIRGFRQFQGENICWALAAKGVMATMLGKNVPACEAVGKATSKQCCGGQYSLIEHCNKGGWSTRVYDAYGVKYMNSGVDFERIFQALKRGSLVNIITDMKSSSFGSRSGHDSFIYRAEKHSNGSYEFFVMDSANGYYSFNTKNLRASKKPYQWEYLSLDISFTWESVVIVNK